MFLNAASLTEFYLCYLKFVTLVSILLVLNNLVDIFHHLGKNRVNWEVYFALFLLVEKGKFDHEFLLGKMAGHGNRESWDLIEDFILAIFELVWNLYFGNNLVENVSDLYLL